MYMNLTLPLNGFGAVVGVRKCSIADEQHTLRSISCGVALPATVDQCRWACSDASGRGDDTLATMIGMPSRLHVDVSCKPSQTCHGTKWHKVKIQPCPCAGTAAGVILKPAKAAQKLPLVPFHLAHSPAGTVAVRSKSTSVVLSTLYVHMPKHRTIGPASAQLHSAQRPHQLMHNQPVSQSAPISQQPGHTPSRGQHAPICTPLKTQKHSTLSDQLVQ